METRLVLTRCLVFLELYCLVLYFCCRWGVTIPFIPAQTQFLEFGPTWIVLCTCTCLPLCYNTVVLVILLHYCHLLILSIHSFTCALFFALISKNTLLIFPHPQLLTPLLSSVSSWETWSRAVQRRPNTAEEHTFSSSCSRVHYYLSVHQVTVMLMLIKHAHALAKSLSCRPSARSGCHVQGSTSPAVGGGSGNDGWPLKYKFIINSEITSAPLSSTVKYNTVITLNGYLHLHRYLPTSTVQYIISNYQSIFSILNLTPTSPHPWLGRNNHN